MYIHIFSYSTYLQLICSCSGMCLYIQAGGREGRKTSGGRACPRPWVSRRPPSIAGALGKEFINHVWWCVRAAQSMALDTLTHKQKRQTSIKVPS